LVTEHAKTDNENKSKHDDAKIIFCSEVLPSVENVFGNQHLSHRIAAALGDPESIRCESIMSGVCRQWRQDMTSLNSNMFIEHGVKEARQLYELVASQTIAWWWRPSYGDIKDVRQVYLFVGRYNLLTELQCLVRKHAKTNLRDRHCAVGFALTAAIKNKSKHVTNWCIETLLDKQVPVDAAIHAFAAGDEPTGEAILKRFMHTRIETMEAAVCVNDLALLQICMRVSTDYETQCISPYWFIHLYNLADEHDHGRIITWLAESREWLCDRESDTPPESSSDNEGLSSISTVSSEDV